MTEPFYTNAQDANLTQRLLLLELPFEETEIKNTAW